MLPSTLLNFCLTSLLAIGLSGSYTQAKITIYDSTWNPDTAITVSSYDQYSVIEPSYNYTGFLYSMVFNPAEKDCILKEIPVTHPLIKEGAKNASSYPNFGAIVSWGLAWNAGCSSIAQIMQKIAAQGETLVSIGYPPLNLIAFFTNAEPGTGELWGPTFGNWGAEEEMAKVKGIIPTFLSREGANKLVERFPKYSPITLRFSATEDPGPWNKELFKNDNTAYMWTAFAVVAFCLLYALVRFLWLSYLGGVRRDIRLTIMILALINTILYLTKSQVRLLANLIIDVVTRYLAIFIFSLLLWHWSVRAKAIFPPKSVIGFRVFIVLHTAIEVILFVFSLARDGLNVAGGFLENRLVFMGVIAPIAAFSGSIVFGGFGIWFFICTYRVRRHSEARWRFIQLSIFSLIASLTFILESATFFIGGFGIVGLNNASPVELNYINTTRDLITCVRSIVSLGVWGVGWPHRGDNFNSSSSPNPQSNKDKDNSNNNNNNSNNIYSNRPNNSSQDRRWSTFGWVRLASALGHHRSSNNGSNSYASSRPKADPRRMNLLEDNTYCEDETINVVAMGETIDIQSVAIPEQYESDLSLPSTHQ